MSLRDFNLGDALYVCSDLRSDDVEQLSLFGFPVVLDELAVFCYALPGGKWTYADDYPLVIGGFVPIRKGVLASWFLASKRAWAEHGRAVTEMAKERLEHAHASGAHRIEVVCLASRKLAQRWYKSIGLKYESTQIGYCIDGSDAVTFVSLKGGSSCA